jgi:hypothetical protein
MSGEEYKPRPIDTSRVRLARDVEELTEKLSRNAHDHWAQQRLVEGWRWGAARDEARKLHPSLIPYEKLPESEKDLDRATAMETVKAILALGFRITRE